MTTDGGPEAGPGVDRFSVLIVDDERNIRTTLSLCLEKEACRVAAVSTGEAAVAALAQERADLCFLDLRLRRESGLDLIPALLAQAPGLAIVVITAYAAVDSAVEAMKRGALDYIAKPFTPAQIRLVVDRMRGHKTLRWRVAELEGRVKELAPDLDLETRSPRMRVALDMVARASASEATVLLRGESGTGKTVLARALHHHSARRERPFAVVSCPALTDELLASELFGHALGAFPGAVRDQPGRVEAAERGTLLLDEIGEMSPAVQARLLRFLQDREFERVGETRTRRADLRVVAATTRDLEADVAAGRFREDLLFRLNIVDVVVPPLRERREDIPRLAQHFLGFAAHDANRPPLELASETLEALTAYAWPGNVRELRNVMERVAILWPATKVAPEALPDRILQGRRPPVVEVGGDHTLLAIEDEHVRRVLARAKTNEEAARTLGIDVSTLWRKRKRLDR